MHASTILVALSTVASVSASALRYRAAAPEPTRAIAIEKRVEAIEKRAQPSDAWVSVDDEAQPETTNTPSATVVDGTTSYENGAPHDLTATVFTITELGKITTSTGSPPNPTASSNGQGAFARCHNKDGDKAPLCDPAVDSTLLVDSTYYITWDPDYFDSSDLKKTNASYQVSVRLDYFNTTSLELQCFLGFYPFYVDKKYLHGYDEHNFTLTLYQESTVSNEKKNITAIWVQLAKYKRPLNPTTSAPTGQTLTIALPTVFGAIVLLLIGGCLWNRQTRRISIGNIMSRSRHGYTGRKSRRIFRKDNGIQLDTRGPLPGGEYRDAPERPRRDSDGLGSLANSPVDPSFQQQGTTGGHNAFRDELARQDRERR
ncbi:hypothetical protein B0T10DRAFT_469431 [Thelonectria olida]|uniref:Uncharacterized protein n=1 Tax=Thelonectria olida TaxID=1576542 RepID=A0A9P8WI31_9HYPO|nr:hypothetical protein B0T10DRAFT_469431 [Thelonectria olida]